MTVERASIAGSTAADDAARAWQELRAEGDIQFAPISPPPPPQTPDWLRSLGEWLEAVFGPVGKAFGASWPAIQTVLILLAILAIALLAWRVLRPLLNRRKSASEPEWAPDRGEAEALLEDADRLAGEGRFDEATHLLLQRSVGQIRAARPDWLHPASTAREIAGLPGLGDRARTAFTAIAARVERSRYALRELGAADWQAARAAYAEFALQDLGHAGAPG